MRSANIILILRFVLSAASIAMLRCTLSSISCVIMLLLLLFTLHPIIWYLQGTTANWHSFLIWFLISCSNIVLEHPGLRQVTTPSLLGQSTFKCLSRSFLMMFRTALWSSLHSLGQGISVNLHVATCSWSVPTVPFHSHFLIAALHFTASSSIAFRPMCEHYTDC